MRNTYQDKNGTYYLRLFVPKVLLPFASKSKIVQSLRTKDRRQAYLRSMEASLAFERWVWEMKNKFNIGSDIRELVITLPNGAKAEFDLEKVAEKDAYESLIGTLAAAPQTSATIVQEIKQSTPLPSVPSWATRARLIDIFESYKVAKSKTFSQSTKDSYFPRVQKFIDFCRSKGMVFADEIRKTHASDYREEVIKLQDSPLTVDNYTKTLKSFFDFAISVGKYGFENPFANMHLVKKSERDKHTDSYIPYTKDEIQRLFVENFEAYCKRFKKPDLFFAPLVALTIGMREDEIAQLYISDIYQKDGVWVFDINDNGDDKEVKNQPSIRLMPLTSQLLQTNFLSYYHMVKEKYGETSLLFPYLTKTASNGYSKNICYNWTQYKKMLITVDESQKVFHSLRKNVGAAMADKLIDLPLRKRVLGHTQNQDVTQTVYGSEYSLQNIRFMLEGLEWNIDFSKFQFHFKNEKVLAGLVNSKAIKARKKAIKLMQQ